MARGTSDYKRITLISNPDKSGNFDLANVEKDIRSIVNNAVKSSLPPNAYFKVGEKQVMPNGQTILNVYVHGNSAPLTEASMRQQANTMTFKGSTTAKYSVTSPTDIDKTTAKALAEDERSKNNEQKEDMRINKGNMLKVVALLTAVTDIARRILSSLLTFSQQTVKDMVSAHNLGMSYEAVRGYRHVETAHGMKEGTITGAVSDIQSKFGNITALDEKSLEALAVVMGGQIKEMIDMGLGSSNPEKVLGAILDTFNAKANAGYNSIGQYVGEQQARRELYSYLLKISPQIADVFATMQEEQHNINSIFRNQYDTFEGMKNALPTKRGGNSDAKYGITVTLGEEYNQVKETLKQIYENFVLGIAPAILPLLRKIADSRIGMTEAERRQRNEENKQNNSRAIASTEKTMQEYKSRWNQLNPSEKAYYRAMEEYVAELKAENTKATIGDKVITPNELRVRGEMIATGKYTEAKDAYNQVAWTGGEVPEIYATQEEVDAVIGAYNFDTPEERARFAKYVADELPGKNAKIKKTIEKQKEKARKQEFSTAKKRAKKEIEQDETIQAMRKRIPWSYRGQFDTLMLAYKVHNLDYDLQSEDWNYAQGMMFKELKRLADAGYVTKTSNTGSYQTVSDKKFELSSANAEFIEGMNPYYGSDDNAYRAWLYGEHRAEIDPHILAEREEKALEDYNQSMAIESLNLLYDTEGAKVNDWTKLVPKTPYAIGGTVIASNERSGSGEVIHKIVLKYTDKSGKTHTQQLFSVLGKEGYEGVLGTLMEIDGDKGTSYMVSQGTTPSQMIDE